jgi:hypothetical protein
MSSPPTIITSKSDQDAATRALLQQYVHRRIPNTHEIYPQLLDLMRQKPNWSEEKIQKIHAFRITRSKLNKALSLKLCFESRPRRWFTVSWSNRASKDPLQSAFRHAIQTQIRTWRRWNRTGACCAQCQSEQKLQVDHKQPQFIELTRTFMDNPLNAAQVPSDFDYHRAGTKFKADDRNFKLRWQRYHQKHAELQWLCQSCNLSRKKA